MARLYLDPGLPADAAPGSRVRLEGAEARHAVLVARVRPGERIAIGDGVGRVATGTVVTTDPLVVELGEVRTEPEPRPAIWLAQALAKGDRDELAIQAATELGVAGVIPWAAERSVVRWAGPKAERGRERWASIVREAAKQSVRAWVPEVAPLASGAELARVPGMLLVLDPDAPVPISSVDAGAAGRVTLVVGPEGGIAPGELESFRAAGAVVARLGPEVLRTSTAGPAALAALHVLLGHW